MLNNVSLLLACRYIGIRTECNSINIFSLLSIFGIAISVVVLILVISIMNGFRDNLLSRVLDVSGDISLHLNDNYDYQDIREYLYENNSISTISNLISPAININTFILSGSDNINGIILKGISDEYLENKLCNKIIEGSCKDLTQGIIIGKKLAENMNLAIGDSIKIFANQTMTTIVGNMPKMFSCTVKGIVDFDMAEYDNMLVHIHLSDIKKYFGYSVDTIEIFLNNHSIAREYAATLTEELGLYAQSWNEKDSYYISIFNTERNVMLLITYLIVILAISNIMTGLMMLVKDKSNSIAILKVMGMSTKNISMIFLIIGLIIGIVGAAFGLLISFLLIVNIDHIEFYIKKICGDDIFSELFYFFDTLPIKVYYEDIVFISSITIVASLLSALYPAYKAAQKPPSSILDDY